jgi:hypothetical protein
VCALRVGEWDWAAALLEEWIPAGGGTDLFAEFFVDRAILTAVRGGDPVPDIEQASALTASVTDTQYSSYGAWARAWAAFSAGRFADARAHGIAAAEVTSFFHALTVPLAARASLWAGDAAGAREALERLNRTMFRGQALSMDKSSIEAGIAALEGREAEALALYRQTIEGWRALKLAWDEALTVVDMVTFLGASGSEERASADWARGTLTDLGALPYLERLESALTTGKPATPHVVSV